MSIALDNIEHETPLRAHSTRMLSATTSAYVSNLGAANTVLMPIRLAQNAPPLFVGCKHYAACRALDLRKMRKHYPHGNTDND